MAKSGTDSDVTLAMVEHLCEKFLKNTTMPTAFKEVLSKYKNNEADFEELYKNMTQGIVNKTKKNLLEAINADPNRKKRLEQMDKEVDARPKRKINPLVKHYREVEADKLMAMVDKRNNENLSADLELLKMEEEQLKLALQLKSLNLPTE